MNQPHLVKQLAGRLPDSSGRVLVVDDEKSICAFMSALLAQRGHETRSAHSGEDAVHIARSGWPDLIILDLIMPGIGGFEAARQLKEDPLTTHIPIVMVTVLGDRESRLRGLEVGAEDFISKPIDPPELLIRVRNLLRLKEYGDFLSGMSRLLEKQVAQKTAELQGSYIDTVFFLARVVEHQDHETAEHISRVAHLSRAVGEYLGMPAGYCETLYYASSMHDIGKICVPARILLKPGALTAEEWGPMHRHPTVGGDLLATGKSPFLRMGREVALSHHELWDGSGYPDGASGEAIPLSGRIVCLCDQYDAMRSQRPYKGMLSHDEVFERMTQGDGRTAPEHFDPAVLNIFKRHHATLDEIYSENRPVMAGAA